MTNKLPELAPIESSMFSHHHYDPNSRKLTVRLKESGKLYEYDDVPIEKNDAFLGNASKGRYFNQRIKGNYLGRQVKED